MAMFRHLPAKRQVEAVSVLMVHLQDSYTAELLKTVMAYLIPVWVQDVARFSAGERAQRTMFCLRELENAAESAHPVVRMAESVACCAYVAGGIDIYGVHYEVHQA